MYLTKYKELSLNFCFNLGCNVVSVRVYNTVVVIVVSFVWKNISIKSFVGNIDFNYNKKTQHNNSV